MESTNTTNQTPETATGTLDEQKKKRYTQEKLQQLMAQAHQAYNDAETPMPDFRNSDFSGLDFTILSHVAAELDFSGSDFHGANLAGLHLFCCNFTGANLRGANLSRTRAQACRFDSADMRGTNFTGTQFQGGHYRRADFLGADLRTIKCDYPDDGCLELPDFAGADFTRANLEGARLFGDFTGANFDGANLSAAIFMEDYYLDSDHLFYPIGCAEDYAEFTIRIQSQLTGANFAGADLTGTLFDGAAGAPARPVQLPQQKIDQWVEEQQGTMPWF